MTPQSGRTNTDSTRTPRLEFKATGAEGAGACWRPYGRDLAVELPDLLAILAPRLGPIHRVIYHLDEWTPAASKLDFGSRRVLLEGYRQLPAHTLEVLGVGAGIHLVLRVITPLRHAEMLAAQQRWDSEGGSGADTEPGVSARVGISP
ncbi:hypothetical protein GFY24_40315 [Nocardia sp. SYP-A9097]|uniref:DUF5994 family protein n=1 Tax=Nocardia sp. SYP-A9097 TaxID=2663237 RepID=UPI00129A630F|nr:DUF5994 family protein [Nocardia sp. SYP-A9097]MRH93570.1 hypothetical protein [Nocardia sp. SYP-A9097]